MSTAGSREAHALGSFAQGNARSMNTDSAEYREHTHTHMTLCSRTHLPPTRSSGFLRRWHRRTGSVVLTAKLIAGYDAGGERRKPGQDGPDAAGVLDLQPGQAPEARARPPGWPERRPHARRRRAVPGRGKDTGPGSSSGPGLRQTARPRERRGGIAAAGPRPPGRRRVRLPGTSAPLSPPSR